MWRSKHLQHIWLDDEGHPWIDDTRVLVYDVATMHRRRLSVEEIHYQLPQLTLGQIYAALSFYHDHRAELDRKIADLLREESESGESRETAWERSHRGGSGSAFRWAAVLALLGLIATLVVWLDDSSLSAPGEAAAQDATASPSGTTAPSPAASSAGSPAAPTPSSDATTTPGASNQSQTDTQNPADAPPGVAGAGQATPPPTAPAIPNSPVPTPAPHKAVTVLFNGFQFDLFFVDGKTDQVKCYYRDPSEKRFGNFGALRDWALTQSKRLLFATNAGIFAPGAGGTPEPIPEGLFIADGQEITPLNEKSGNGNFYMMPNGVFAVTASGYQIVETAQYKALRQVDQATQSGPLLVLNGVINKHFTPGSSSRYVRNGVGVKDAQTAIFAISRTPVNFDTFARLFHDYLQCDNALYLDGAISEMYLPAVGRNDDQGNFAGMLGVMTNDD